MYTKPTLAKELILNQKIYYAMWKILDTQCELVL